MTRSSSMRARMRMTVSTVWTLEDLHKKRSWRRTWSPQMKSNTQVPALTLKRVMKGTAKWTRLRVRSTKRTRGRRTLMQLPTFHSTTLRYRRREPGQVRKCNGDAAAVAAGTPLVADVPDDAEADAAALAADARFPARLQPPVQLENNCCPAGAFPMECSRSKHTGGISATIAKRSGELTTRVLRKVAMLRQSVQACRSLQPQTGKTSKRKALTGPTSRRVPWPPVLWEL
mmetsp:Transcript_36910/g.85330  ORF Transcript_36910/g.85330 Transcript_36910/m.85330 type:complete len:230 (-) Transcript_36910:789-1478(-)